MQFHKYRIQPSEGKASMMYMDGYTLNNTNYMSENKNSKPIPSQTLHRLIYSVSQEECARLQEGVPYVKIYQYNPKHLCPKLNAHGDNGQRKVWSSGGSTHCTCQLTTLSMSVLECGVILWQFSSRSL